MHIRWSCPSDGAFSISTDAAVNSEGKAGFGVLIRDTHGSIRAAISGPLLFVSDVEQAEANAILEGLLLAKSMQMQNVEVLSDSSIAINRLSNAEDDPHHLRPCKDRRS